MGKMASPSVMILAALVGADIPVHCLRSDIAGDWTLHLGKTVKRGESSEDVPDFADGGIAKDYCFSGHPNTNDRNVKLDIEKLMSQADVAMDVFLTPGAGVVSKTLEGPLSAVSKPIIAKNYCN